MTRIKALRSRADAPHCSRGWEEIKNHNTETSNQKLWYCPKENRYYNYDTTGHGGGVWKEFKKAGKSFKRIATLDDAFKDIRG
ncbi:toxin C-terminal domain-containing protein [Candidatus Dependentiae bacterium]|nr:toxin C-terminal domain-containing protein [Candidatus Dependentiae bacterium]